MRWTAQARSALCDRGRGKTCVVLVSVILVLSVAQPAHAQTIIRALDVPTGSFLSNVVAAGDLDGDGVVDLVVGAPESAQVFVLSGATGAVVHTIQGPADAFYFGYRVDCGADLDGDGVSEILVGDPLYFFGNGAGRIHVYSGATYAALPAHEHVGASPGEGLGSPVRFFEDMTGDGIPEYAAGGLFSAPGAPSLPGRVHVYDGATGAELVLLVGSEPGDLFGVSIESLGPVDPGDTIPDFAIGAPFTSSGGLDLNGAVDIYAGGTWAHIRTDAGSENNVRVGWSLGRLDDLDGMGVDDYVTSWHPLIPVGPFAFQSNGGLVVSGESGATLLTVVSPPPLGGSGGAYSVSDVDGDGHRDLLLGNQALPRIPPGYATIVSSGTGEVLFRIDDPAGQCINFPGLPSAVELFGDAEDIDQDGLEDIIVTEHCSEGGGRIYVLSLRPLYALASETTAASGEAVEFEINAGVPHAGSLYFLLMSATAAAQGPCGAGIRVGPLPVILPLCPDAALPLSIALANTPPFVDTLGLTDEVTGRATAQFDLSGFAPVPPVLIGVTFTFAYVVKAPGGGPWDFASNAQGVLIVP
jgi:hypothetical protein